MFFAAEFLLALYYVNLSYLCPGDLSLGFLISGFLLAASGLSALSGFMTLHHHGRSEGNWENTTSLVKKGVYGLIRHPIYTSLLLMSLAVFLRRPALSSLIFWLGASAFLIKASLIEEQENLAKFGREYSEYMLETKRYVPFII